MQYLKCSMLLKQDSVLSDFSVVPTSQVPASTMLLLLIVGY
jgi:hypothetical protein